MPIRVFTGSAGWRQLKASWKSNRKHYLQEALGLAIFMISACFFGAMIFSGKSQWYHLFSNDTERNITTGILMGATAWLIFYSPFTAPSGSHINPAVTITFWRLGKMCHWDSLFYILFQFIGGTVAVYMMQLLLGPVLIDPPVNSSVTIPGKAGILNAALMEVSIAFVTMSMVLFTSNHDKLKKYTRIFAACLVCVWVIIAGPVSGFGMNPARSFASALPGGIWTAFWIYLLMPFAGMLLAAEVFILSQKKLSKRLEPVL